MDKYLITILIYLVFFMLGIIVSFVLLRSRVRELTKLLSDYYLENQALLLKVQEIEAKLKKDP